MTSPNAITDVFSHRRTAVGHQNDSSYARSAAKNGLVNGHNASKTHLDRKGHDFVASCQSKTSYADARAAQQAIRGMARQGKARNMRTYPCKNCGGWHITRK
jgi:hypothetical protein